MIVGMVDEATREAARMLGARGASAGGHARAAALSPERRREIARLAGEASAAAREAREGPRSPRRKRRKR